MRVTIARNVSRETRLADAESPGTIKEEVEFPNRPFWTIGGITGLVSALATALVGLMTVWGVTQPDSEQRRLIEQRAFQADLLERALQVESADGRRTGVNLLLGTGLLTLPDQGRIVSALQKGGPDTLPRWPANTPSRATISLPAGVIDTTHGLRPRA
jgi:hypothetical protein